MGRDKLFDLLRANRLLVRPRKPSKPRTTNGAHTRWTNKLATMEIDGANQAVIADITYLRTLDGFCYLALISDKYSHKIMGWDLADSLELDGTLRALSQALKAIGKESTTPTGAASIAATNTLRPCRPTGAL